MSILEYIGSIGGVGAVLAVLIFWAYRYSVRQMREDRKYMEDRLTSVIIEYNKASKGQQRATIKHTKALTELITWLKAKNGNG